MPIAVGGIIRFLARPLAGVAAASDVMANLLFEAVKKFATPDLSRGRVDNVQMGENDWLEAVVAEDPITKQPVQRARVVSKIFDNTDFGFHKTLLKEVTT